MKNLDVYFDTSLTMKRQVNATSSDCHYEIHNIAYMRYLMTDACKTLRHALATSHLDYGNVLLFDLPSTLMEQMRTVRILQPD